MQRSGRIVVQKPEEINILSTDSALHFTGTIAMNSHEEESISGLLGNEISILGVNGQSMQKLKYRLIIWGGSGFDSTTLNSDSYVSDVVLDFTDELSAFQIGAANQYRLDVGGLDIPLTTRNLILYCSLQNLSPTAKLAGSSGAVQFDIKYGLRL